MVQQLTPSLPQESEAQAIGQRAEVCLTARRPLAWRVRSLEGTDDAGLDFQVQLVGENRYQHIFRLQLKGTESPSLNASGEFYSISLKASTLNYYERTVEPVLIVLCDLSIDVEPNNCPCYFVWAHDEIRRIKQETTNGEDAVTRTVRIPRANQLTRDFDVSQVLERHRRLNVVAGALDQAVLSAVPDYGPDQRIQILGDVASHLPRRGKGYIDSLSDPGPTPWPQAPRDSIAGRLNSVDQYLRLGDTRSADRVLHELSPAISMAASLERAEYEYLIGRSLSLLTKEDAAVVQYQKAHDLEPTVPKYVIAYVETQLRIRSRAGALGALGDLQRFLSSPEPDIVGLSARLLAAEGRFEEAEAKLRTLPATSALCDKAIIATLRGDFQSVVGICDAGLADPLAPDPVRQALHLLRARAQFNAALHLPVVDQDSVTIPVFGPTNVDTAQLKRAWQDIEQAAILMRAAGWPLNVEYLAEIWGTAAIVLGHQDNVLPDVLEAAEARPGLPVLQNCLERVAVQCGKLDIALDAIDRQPPSDDRTFRRIILLYQARNFVQCLDEIQSEKTNLPRAHQLFPVCMTFGVLAAEQIAREDVANDLEKDLQVTPGWAHHAAIAAYFRAITRNALAKDDALVALDNAYESTKSLDVAIHLFHELDANNERSAARCIELARALTSRSQLGLESILQLAQAHVTMREWEPLLNLCDSSIERFGNEGRLVAVRAFALDKAGRTAEAVEQLQKLIKTGAQDRFAVNTYVNIVIRCGFIEEAIVAVEGMLSRETDRNARFEQLRLLFSLVYRSDPQSQRPENIAWRIGTICDQDDEGEEGLFLIAYLTATLADNVVVSEERKEELHRRLARFVDRFPTSKILRSATLPEKPSFDDLERMVESVTGRDPERLKRQRRLLNQLERGALPVPFSWRPRNVLINVADVAVLWEIAKASNRDAVQYHLKMVQADWKATDPEHLARDTPLIDLATLLVIHDLRLFDTMFTIFQKVAIGQRTLVELQRLCDPMAGSMARETCLGVVAELKKRFSQVVQPIGPTPEDSERARNDQQAFDEVIELSRSGQFVLYSDDAVYRMYANLEGARRKSICTLDVLNAADHKEVLPIKEIAKHIVQLIRWNVGIVVTQRNLIACIPDSVAAADSVGSAVTILQRDSTTQPLFEGVWNVRKNYVEFVQAGAVVLAELVREPANRTETIAAIWGVWYFKATLRGDAGIAPPLKHLVVCLLKAVEILSNQNVAAFRKLWDVFLAALPLEYRERMDEKSERQAIEMVGRVAAELNHARPEGTPPVPFREKLQEALTKGTDFHDRFVQAYLDAEKQSQLAASKRRG